MDEERVSSAHSACLAREQLVAFARRELPAAAQTVVMDHLRGCLSCLHELIRLEAECSSTVGATSGLGENIRRTLTGGERTVSAPSPLPAGGPSTAGPTTALPAQIGMYQLGEKLGQGGMGAVYKAWHTRLKKAVAIKTLPLESFHDADSVARFLREMEAVGSFDHPNLIRATDAGEAQGIHFLVMEYIEGLDLARLVRQCGPLALADACEVVRQAAVGLQCAHEHGRVHRDVKPSNLMISVSGQVKVCDLGLALLSGDGSGDRELTRSNQVMGTADYMAPEQADNPHGVDIRADVYSLGCTLYKLLTGRAPFDGPSYSSFMKKMQAHASKPVPPVRQLRPDMPPELVAVLDRMLAKEPSGRYATPGEVAQALQPFTIGSDLASLVAAARQSRASIASASPTAPASLADTGSNQQLARTLPGSVPTRAPVGAPPAAPSRVRRIRLLWVALPALVLVGAIAFLPWRGERPAGDKQVSDESPSGPRPAAPAPGVWHNLLDREPTVLWWPENSVPPRYDPRLEVIQADCKEVGLIGLGTAPAPGYRIQVKFRQASWQGGMGVFFGYHEAVHAGKPCYRFQRIELRPQDPNQRNPQAFGLWRIKSRVVHIGTPRQTMEDENVQSVAVMRPRSPEETLEVEVASTAYLAAVHWGTQEASPLADGQANAHVPREDYVGAFGIFQFPGAVEVSSARVMFLKKGAP